MVTDGNGEMVGQILTRIAASTGTSVNALKQKMPQIAQAFKGSPDR